MAELFHLVVTNPMTSIIPNKTTWDILEIAGIQHIERLVAEFYVECSYIPSRYFRVKITEHQNGTYISRLNVCLRNVDAVPEWISGLGESIDAALADAIQQLMNQFDQRGQGKYDLTEDDFEWAASEDF
jgi:hypothetical protein